MRSACRVEIVGPPGSDKAELCHWLRQCEDTHGRIDWIVEETPTAASDALIFACPAQGSATALRQHLTELARRLGELSAQRGQRCEAAGFPVFVVITQADLLAGPGQPFEDWLEAVETRKEQISRLFFSLLGPGGTQGFGAPRVHLWATASHRPSLPEIGSSTPEPFGVEELVRQVRAAIADHRRRQTRQQRRLRVLLVLSVAALLVLLLTAGVFLLIGSARSELWPKQPEPPWEPGELLVEGERLLETARRLIAFEGYVRTLERDPHNSPPSASRFAVDWQTWHDDGRRILADAPGVRSRLNAERVGETLCARLQDAEDELAALRGRAAALGLVPNDDSRPAWLVFSAQSADNWSAWRTELQERFSRVNKAQVSEVQRAWPPEVPAGVVDLYRRAARAGLENLLEPVRREIERRLMQIGPETAEAWQALAEGWLSNQAESDLYEWRNFALLMMNLAGETDPTDPLIELVSFLRQTEFALPLDRVGLRLPPSITVGNSQVHGLKPAGSPLIIRVEHAQGAATVLNLVPLEETGPLLTGPHEYVFAATRQSPLSKGRLHVRPGDRLSARLLLQDAEGTKWDLVWTTRDSPSQVYTQAVLAQAPRIRPIQAPAGEPDAIAFGVQLRFADPQAFSLPKLFPR